MKPYLKKKNKQTTFETLHFQQRLKIMFKAFFPASTNLYLLCKWPAKKKLKLFFPLGSRARAPRRPSKAHSGSTAVALPEHSRSTPVTLPNKGEHT